LAYDARTQNDLAKWWATGTGSVINRLSEIMDDMPDGPAIYHVDADDDWTVNPAAADEWYVATATKPDDVAENLAGWRKMTNVADDSETGDGAGLGADEWCYDTDNNRVYIRLSDDSDPNDTDVRKHYAWDGSGAGSAIMTETVEDAVYLIHLPFEVGDGTTSTTLESFDETVYYSNSSYPVLKANATLTLGKEASSYNIRGALWLITGVYHTVKSVQEGGTFNIFGSRMHNINECLLKFDGGTLNLKNSIFSGTYSEGLDFYKYFRLGNGLIELNLTDVIFTDLVTVQIYKTPTIATDIKILNCYRGIDSFITVVLTNIEFGNNTVSDIYASGANADITVINPNGDVITPVISNATGLIYKKYSCNIHTADKNGDDLASVSIDCEYAHLVEGSDSKTYKCIADHTAVDADHKPITGTDWADYWVLYDATVNPDPQIGGDWDTGFDYKSGTAEFATQTTDANGDMTEQNIQYKKWLGTSEILEARIHKFTFSKAGCETLPKKDIIVDGSIGKEKPWQVTLQDPKRKRYLWALEE